MEKIFATDGETNVDAHGEASAQCPPLTQVILAGGSGTRLWPVSREQFPKQLIDVIGDQTLLQATMGRMDDFSPLWTVTPEPIIVCGAEHYFATYEQAREVGVNARIVVEPGRRDTAPALTLAALAASAEDEDAILVTMPADHAIANLKALHKAIEIAAGYADAGAIATLGVPPTGADTGFGYIRLGNALQDGVHRIERFVEKPAPELAAQYVESGNYWWNSGMFVVRASVWLDVIQRFQPQIHDACVRAYEGAKLTDGCVVPDAEAFLQSPSDSIDYAVMEHLGKAESPFAGIVVPLDAGWSDLGSWDAVWQAMEKDESGNASNGRVLFEGATATYARSQGGRLLACVGTNDLIVVETDDAVLVADRSHVQDIKGLVSRIKAEKSPEADAHRKVRRPWGFYDSIDHGDRFQVKRIVVMPGARLSLQMHHHRAEHWVVVSGTALVTRGDEQFLLGENESTYIPLGIRHRLENPGCVPLQIIEVQSGSYLGEDDIVRFDDKYGRAG
ncbi:mannose-1-phosphate guanylyltransferase/mannose-6-phosphate isomerase [Paraburkholderia rhynchosiae]|uniref:mannose-1-phosphate guanylyltransferase n=1 Tax=Paraburkholderia rhynchosiae TaxID=487049 RepID=A0A2N7WSA3_9BURK|nr:mannose-1-phosphate guanylyltransferase/mannose-6-phosphate isomerase [Paraburkholderia rhynchosiae]PMS32338.1 mannose-1-phosphate guanylyltransferase/mannose-6-phosphate isomerase [Paraburkholderia rhynchosiae]CAB3731766.1 Alginate biosynthesis protein AlgA [Paraburkholderia rhynchosiae]